MAGRSHHHVCFQHQYFSLPTFLSSFLSCAPSRLSSSILYRSRVRWLSGWPSLTESRTPSRRYRSPVDVRDIVGLEGCGYTGRHRLRVTLLLPTTCACSIFRFTRVLSRVLTLPYALALFFILQEIYSESDVVL